MSRVELSLQACNIIEFRELNDIHESKGSVFLGLFYLYSLKTLSTKQAYIPFIILRSNIAVPQITTFGVILVLIAFHYVWLLCYFCILKTYSTAHYPS
jgi:hypothetical protein